MTKRVVEQALFEKLGIPFYFSTPLLRPPCSHHIPWQDAFRESGRPVFLKLGYLAMNKGERLLLEGPIDGLNRVAWIYRPPGERLHAQTKRLLIE